MTAVVQNTSISTLRPLYGSAFVAGRSVQVQVQVALHGGGAYNLLMLTPQCHQHHYRSGTNQLIE